MRASESALPSKLFFRIGEVAGLVGVEPHVLRYWEREFRSIRPTKSAKGQRVYSRKDVENLLRVRDLLYRDGFTIAGAKKRLQRAVEAPDVEAAPDGDDESGERIERSDADVSGASIAVHTRSALDEREVTPSGHNVGPSRQVASTAKSHESVGEMLRHKLTALRAEVETFLNELEDRRSERA